MISCVDLFCGVGGLTHGLANAGINVVAGYDIDEASRFAYEANNSSKFVNKDVATITAARQCMDQLVVSILLKLLFGYST